MLIPGQVVESEVAALGASGEGVCKPGGQALFVPFALPGEKVRARVERVQKTHAFGTLLEVLSPSPDRVQPPCPYFGRCGGCAVQHMGYEAQLAFKTQAVRDALQRIGKVGAEVLPAVGLSDPWRYRNKTAMVMCDGDGGPQAGFYAWNSHSFIPVEYCLISSVQSDAAAKAVRGWMARHGVSAYDEATGRGLVRHTVTRTGADGRCMVTLAAQADALPREDALVAGLRDALPGLDSVCLTRVLPGDSPILGDTYRTLWGGGILQDSMLGLAVGLSPLSFFQINHAVCAQMYAYAVAQAAAGGNGLLLDVYSGIGTMGLLAARAFKRVIGVELSPVSVADARQNAVRNGITNAEFREGYAERALPALIQGGLRPDAVILDPPRKGAHPEVLDAVVRAAPPRVVYVSCHPGTLARDAAILKRSGYRAESAQPFDMFCQTSQVETVLTLTRG